MADVQFAASDLESDLNYTYVAWIEYFRCQQRVLDEIKATAWPAD